MKEVHSLNSTLYTDLPVDELDERLAMEELEDRLELACWPYCGVQNPNWCSDYCYDFCTPKW